MGQGRNKSRRFTLTIALAILIGGLVGPVSPVHASTPGNSYLVHPIRKYLGSDLATDLTNPFCYPKNGVPTWLCYAPSDLKTAYEVPPDLDGTGQTIVIIDAFGSPTIAADLATFDAKFGLAAPPSFVVNCPAGCPTFDPRDRNQSAWAGETTLDVEWAHAMAPGANLVLVVSQTSKTTVMNAAVEAAINDNPGGIFSQSFGSFERNIAAKRDEVRHMDQLYRRAAVAGDTVLAASGDWGATNYGTTANAVFPASDPFVTSIGGTEGAPYYSGRLHPPPVCDLNVACRIGLARVKCASATDCQTVGYGGEKVWNESRFGLVAGGAESIIFRSPSYQAGLTGSTQRTTPDVSINAAIGGGVITYSSYPGSTPGYYVWGGTSAGSPEWAGIVALADQARAEIGKPSIGPLNNSLYAIAQSGEYSNDFHDITRGNNRLAGTPFGYSAKQGYDIASGWGTPRVANLIDALVARA